MSRTTPTLSANGLLRPLIICVFAVLSCKGGADSGRPVVPERPATPPAVSEMIYETDLKPGWTDGMGWATRELGDGPLKLTLDNAGGLILHKPTLQGAFGGLRLRYKLPASFADRAEDFLAVRFDSSSSTVFPRVELGPRHRYPPTPDGWVDVYVDAEELNPRGLPFDRVVLWAPRKDLPTEPVLFDRIGLTAAKKEHIEARALGGGRLGSVSKGAQLQIDCKAPTHPISPLIYGIAFDGLHETKDKHPFEMGATARRWGGNPTSRYNWKLGNAWNTGNDYFFRNVSITDDPKYSYDKFLETNLAHKMQTALTLPMIGWVAKDTTSYGFPVSKYGPQVEVDPDVPEAGNGLLIAGQRKQVTPGKPTETSVAAPPEFIGEWVKSIREKDKKRGRSVQMYILDNEPMLWSTTHRDVHPEPVNYDELLTRTIAYGSAVRKADPEAVIAGPAEWGWTNFFWSAADFAVGTTAHLDRRAHDDVPLLPWYLRKLREHEQKTGVRLLDVVDVHFYPQSNVGIGEKGDTDRETNARRIRATRSLWDPTYVDESWIKEKVQLIPRLKQWIADNYPGRGISIGEYNFGAAGHMSGGLAEAEALGRFAQEGITSAFYFQYPKENSPAFWAFRAYRNFDGKGGRFLDTWLPTTSSEGTSFFASRDTSGKHVVAIALNLDEDVARDAQVALTGCGTLTSARVFSYSAEPTGFAEKPAPKPNGTGLVQALPPYSITVFDLQVER